MNRTELKSIITLIVVVTLCLITVGSLAYGFITKDTTLFTVSFGLFGAQAGSILTYYFTRKSKDNIGTDEDK